MINPLIFNKKTSLKWPVCFPLMPQNPDSAGNKRNKIRFWRDTRRTRYVCFLMNLRNILNFHPRLLRNEPF